MGLVVPLINMNPNLIIIHYIIHPYLLMSKAQPDNWKEAMNSVIHIVNFIQGRATNLRLFECLGKEMGAEHTVLLFHANVQWLIMGKCSTNCLNYAVN